MKNSISLPIKRIEEDASSFGYFYKVLSDFDKQKHDENTLILFICLALYSPKESSQIDFYSLNLAACLENKLDLVTSSNLHIPDFDPSLNVSKFLNKAVHCLMIMEGFYLATSNDEFNSSTSYIEACFPFSGSFLEPLKEALDCSSSDEKLIKTASIFNEHYIKNLGKKGVISSLDSLEDYLLNIRHNLV